jgi:hypothetical protein
MVFSKLFSKFFKKTKKIEPPSREEIEAVVKYRLVYNSKKKKYEKILVYSESELEDG